jgi:aryl-alcohol dehydrogenase-like predicted oxidoreductase
LKWLLQKAGVTAPIIGARTMEQLNDNLASAEDWSLSDAQMKQLDDASAPELIYPYDFVQRALR